MIERTNEQWHDSPLLHRGRPYDGAVVDEDGRLIIPHRPQMSMRRVYDMLAEQTRKQAKLYELMARQYD
jgi:hypothetical protein